MLSPTTMITVMPIAMNVRAIGSSPVVKCATTPITIVQTKTPSESGRG
ncbi:hypothetical protein [Fodinicola feengrottensis]|nr:hypothetical protein [Fodinicola feengrottensis]